MRHFFAYKIKRINELKTDTASFEANSYLNWLIDLNIRIHIRGLSSPNLDTKASVGPEFALTDLRPTSSRLNTQRA